MRLELRVLVDLVEQCGGLDRQDGKVGHTERGQLELQMTRQHDVVAPHVGDALHLASPIGFTALDDVQEFRRAQLARGEDERVQAHPQVDDEPARHGVHVAEVPDHVHPAGVDRPHHLESHRGRQPREKLVADLAIVQGAFLKEVLAQPELQLRTNVILRHERVEARELPLEDPFMRRSLRRQVAKGTDEVAPQRARGEHDEAGDQLLSHVKRLRKNVAVADRGDRHRRKVQAIRVHRKGRDAFVAAFA